jgi:hypothetical protein
VEDKETRGNKQMTRNEYSKQAAVVLSTIQDFSKTSSCVKNRPEDSFAVAGIKLEKKDSKQ